MSSDESEKSRFASGEASEREVAAMGKAAAADPALRKELDEQIRFDRALGVLLESDSRNTAAKPPPWRLRRYKANSYPPQVEQLDNGLLLVIEDPDLWAHDTEPVFWTD